MGDLGVREGDERGRISIGSGELAGERGKSESRRNAAVEVKAEGLVVRPAVEEMKGERGGRWVRGGEGDGGDGAAIWRRRPEAAATAAAARRLHDVNQGTRQGEAAASAAGTTATRGGAAAVAAVGLPPCSSLSSHLR